MNFLAHIYLSGNSDKIAIGNFIADSVRGKQYLSYYDDEIIKGIQLHRAIDEFTDTHPIVGQSVEKLYTTQRKYASVVVDIFYDHFLAKKWQNFHQTPLQDFAQYFYQVLQQNFSILPKRIQDFLPYMIKEDWLYNYRKLAGIERVFEGMARRTTFRSNMKNATQDLKNHYSFFEKQFDDFFPLLEEYVIELNKNS